MSNVKEGERKQGKLEVLNKARELCLYSIQILQNQKTFNPAIDEDIITDMKTQAKQIYFYCYQANDVRVYSEADWTRRDQYQEHA